MRYKLSLESSMRYNFDDMELNSDDSDFCCKISLNNSVCKERANV